MSPVDNGDANARALELVRSNATHLSLRAECGPPQAIPRKSARAGMRGAESSQQSQTLLTRRGSWRAMQTAWYSALRRAQGSGPACR